MEICSQADSLPHERAQMCEKRKKRKKKKEGGEKKNQLSLLHGEPSFGRHGYLMSCDLMLEGRKERKKEKRDLARCKNSVCIQTREKEEERGWSGNFNGQTSASSHRGRGKKRGGERKGLGSTIPSWWAKLNPNPNPREPTGPRVFG